MARIALITPGYLASTPRVWKEALTLHAAGHQVHVVSTRGGLPAWRQFDQDLKLPEGISRSVIGWSEQVPEEATLYHRSRIRHRLARAARGVLCDARPIAARVLSRLHPELVRAAVAWPAQLYIGHYPAGLAAARLAASTHHARLGYDLEDLHLGEAPPYAHHELRALHTLERAALPRLVHVTAASLPMAHAFADYHRCAPPVLVRNTFPASDPSQQRTFSQAQTLRLYWFSQTIGPHRGLETAIAALALLPPQVELHLRGQISASDRRALLAPAERAGTAARIHVLAPTSPATLIDASRDHAIGLALEVPYNRNRDLTVTNKFYQYLQAGLAIIATRTTGQAAAMQTLGWEEHCVPVDDAAALAQAIQRFVDSPALLQQRQAEASAAAAGDCAHTHDQARLLASVEAALK